jgi:DNA-binding PadR family transcriptional regulator
MARRARHPERPLPDLAYLVLGYVGLHPDGVHGYRLGRRLGGTPLGLPSVRLGQVYRLLHALGRRGWLAKRLETGAARPPRWLFTATRAGATVFGRWLAGPPRGGAPVREQLLLRLRFSDQLPDAALRRLVRDAMRECVAEQRELHAALRAAAGVPAGAQALVSLALEKRLAADRSWLAEMTRLVDAGASGIAPIGVTVADAGGDAHCAASGEGKFRA